MVINPKLGPEVIKLNCAQNFNCSKKLNYQQMIKFLALSLSDVVFIMLINKQLRDIAIRTRASLVKQIRIRKESINKA